MAMAGDDDHRPKSLCWTVIVTLFASATDRHRGYLQPPIQPDQRQPIVGCAFDCKRQAADAAVACQLRHATTMVKLT